MFLIWLFSPRIIYYFSNFKVHYKKDRGRIGERENNSKKNNSQKATHFFYIKAVLNQEKENIPSTIKKKDFRKLS